ncbi:DDT domain-containing protein PTM [Rhodamnia argentea]|uniref:DDT domain-containing protein PTM n=1 Tax=Rhodamnia argentea TaxID=178133 RepID=A0A8B8NIV9_9MYRT|nr:DDT domain-containing protein PTM [Rhodamnia argentea]
MEFVGRTVTKGFKGFGALTGTVRSYDPASGLFKIVYDGGDSEELESREMAALFQEGSRAEVASGAMRPGRRSKKRRHAGVEGASNACSDKVVVVGLEAVGNEGLRGGEGFCGDLQRNGWVSEDLRGKINLNDPVEENIEDNLAGAEVCNGYSSRHVDGKGGFDLNSGFDLNEGLNLNDGCDTNVSSEKKAVKRSRIDLNLEATSDLDENLEEDSLSERKKCLIDLNLGVDAEAKDVECNVNGQLCESMSCQLVEDINVDIARNGEERFIESNIANGTSQEVPVEIDARSGVRPMSGSTDAACEEERSGLIDVSVSHVFGNESFGDIACDSLEDSKVSLPQRDGAFKTCDAMHTGNQGNFASPHEHGSRRGRKRKYLNNLNSAGTVLRRSARRGSTKSCDAGVAPLDAVNDLTSSPAVSAITEDKPEDGIPSPKLQLPPSSQDVKLDGTLVLDGFCVYAFLRSFGSLLFLSPFELEDFVVALKSDSANLLVDSIHVSLLITLRKHLEHLSCEGSMSALNCLRSLNWDLLDLVTWPIFLVEYLLLHGSKLQGGLELCHINLLKDDYYKQPMPVKVEVLRCLCDEVMEVEVIRSELSRRSSVTDPDVDIDRSMKRTGAMDASGRAHVTEGTTDDTDWNSDECCLCKMDGNLICCDGCPAAYHSRCVGVVNDLLPEGDWYCPECTLERNKSGIRSRRSFRGAERLGIDPHGRLYYSCYDYLLVLDSSETEVSFYYYHKDDLHLVTEVLQCSAKSNSGILKAINRQWGIHFSSRKTKAILGSSNSVAPLELPVKGQFVAASMTVASLPPCAAYEGTGKADDDKHLEEESLLQASDLTGFETSKSGKEVPTVVETPHVSSEGSTSSDPAKQWQSCSNGYVQLLEKFEIPGRFPNQGDFCMTSAISDCKADKAESAATTVASLTFISAKNDAPVEQGRTTYVNLYRFGQIAASVAEELAEKSSDKVKEDHVRSDEETILIQLKAISKRIAKFSWPDEISVAAQKEKCGWCFLCRFPSDEFDCLFKLYAQPAQEGFGSEMDILQSLPSKKGHLIEVIGQIISMECRLRGLLLGPWLSPHYTKIWHRSVTKALDLSSLKSLLLKLESNLRHLAISEEWFKYEDSSVMLGSASHVVTSASCESSKPSSSRKRGRRSDLESSKPSHNSSSAPSTFWWRGGRLSRRVFNWKVLPRSLIHKAARQAGCMKIPGILYPESSDFARRSKHVAWRAAVESSISTEQLALQVRELHSNIRWEDIENTNPLSKFDKELKKSARAFKKVIIRRKALEGDAAKYLLDFGKRRVIPDVVMRHGSIVQEGSSERKKYWLNECFVPLHLLKSFEEKRIARNSNKMSTSGDSDSHSVKKFSDKMGSARLCKGDMTLKKQLCKAKGLSYLFSRAERAEFSCCGHCKRDVPIREAVSCQYCKGIFHKRHVRKSAGAIADECTYTCHQCQTGKPQKVMERVGKTEKPRGNMKSRTGKGKIIGKSAKSLSKKSKKALAKRRLVKLRGVKRAATGEQSVQSLTCRRVPLRRSARQAIKSIALQNKSRGIKKGKRMKYKRRMPKKPEKDTSWKKKRTEVCYSRWVNGLLLSTRASEEQVVNFGKMRLIHPNGNVKVERTEVKCHLCGEVAHDSLSNYIACESCEEWYHGDAFGLDDEKMHQLTGFRCHECRKRAPPICPYGPTTKRSKSAEVQNDAAFECSEDVLNVSPPSNEVNFRDDSNGKENSAASVPVDEAL